MTVSVIIRKAAVNLRFIIRLHLKICLFTCRIYHILFEISAIITLHIRKYYMQHDQIDTLCNRLFNAVMQYTRLTEQLICTLPCLILNISTELDNTFCETKSLQRHPNKNRFAVRATVLVHSLSDDDLSSSSLSVKLFCLLSLLYNCKLSFY